MISIIIMTRNEEKNIGNMLESIVSQNFKGEYEIIVVDADSTDRTREIILSYCDLLPLIVVDGLGKGIGADRNIGAETCRGDIVFFTEGDCYLNRGFLQQIQRIFEDHNLIAWTTIAYPTEASGLVDLTYRIYNVSRYLLTLAPYPLKGYSVSGAILVIRQEAWHRLGGFQEGSDMNDDGIMGRKIRDCYRGKNQFVFCLSPEIPIYRIVMDRFDQGYFKTMNHYVYVLGNFFPFLVKYFKNMMVYEGLRFKNEKQKNMYSDNHD